jgi:hypothetical protein
MHTLSHLSHGLSVSCFLSHFPNNKKRGKNKCGKKTTSRKRGNKPEKEGKGKLLLWLVLILIFCILSISTRYVYFRLRGVLNFSSYGLKKPALLIFVSALFSFRNPKVSGV